MRDHSTADILRELVQNEYDAGGTQLDVSFGHDLLTISGNGTPISATGWKRLSVLLGTGRVVGAGDDPAKIEPKRGGIGSKNFGMRSLFHFGDRIIVKSGGLKTVLDCWQGTLDQPVPDEETHGRPGVLIQVPFRRAKHGAFEPFDAEKEADILNAIASDLAATVVKLALPGSRKSLQRVTLSSTRCERRLTWIQRVRKIPCARDFTALRRTIVLEDVQGFAAPQIERREIAELEFQRSFLIPHHLRSEAISEYYRVPGARLRLGVSLRLFPSKRGKVELGEPGRFYYPLGSRQSTGNAISISAPFEMGTNRAAIIDPTDAGWNAWLIEQAADLSLDLLVNDWFERFGAEAYLALHPNNDGGSRFSELISDGLRQRPCWPTRARKGRSGAPTYVRADEVVVPEAPEFGAFLEDTHSLDDRLGAVSAVQEMACDAGAPRFGLDSLVRLRCAGPDGSRLETKLKEGAANYYYTDFPADVIDEKVQRRFAHAFDRHPRLSQANTTDLENTATTLTATGTLAPAKDLWIVDPEVADTCPVLSSQRLHPVLAQSRFFQRRCQKFNFGAWVFETARRAKLGTASEEERHSLYRYILKAHRRFDTRTTAALRSAPVLLDHQGAWAIPTALTRRDTPVAAELDAVLRFPHADVEADPDLCRRMKFRTRLDGSDLIRYALLVAANPALSPSFERTLQRLSRLLDEGVVKRLSAIPFLRSTRGGLARPLDLYLPTKTMRACVGDTAPYVDGERTALYRRLGCRDQPSAVDILAYLAQLRLQDRPPERPETLYPSLVRAIKRDQRGNSNDLRDKPILWMGAGYSRPSETLLGGQHRRIFLGAVAVVADVHDAILRAYAELGAAPSPQNAHWRRLFEWFAARAGAAGSRLAGDELYAVLEAYRRLDGPPYGLPNDAKYLLDREKRLHSRADAERNRYLIDDDPIMATAINDANLPIAFAFDLDWRSVHRFYEAAGLRRLTEVRTCVGLTIGEEREPPRSIDPARFLRSVQRPEFLSALEALLAREAAIGEDQIAGFADVPTGCDLRSLRSIAFYEELRIEYKVDGLPVSVPTPSLLYGDRILVAEVKRSSDVYGGIATALTAGIVSDPGQQRALVDAVYRLLTSESDEDMAAYLAKRGIPWSFALDGSERPSDEIESAAADIEEERRVRNAIAEEINERLVKPTAPSQLRGTRAPDLPDETIPPAEKPPTVLPRIEDVTPVVAPVSPSWSPAPRSSMPTGRGGPFRAPTNRDQERDSLIGARGEEIVYREELRRLREMGVLEPESKVVWTARSDPGADHDIQSINEHSEVVWIEVKATSGISGRFQWPRAEFEKALTERRRYVLCRVYLADTEEPIIKRFPDPVAHMVDGSIRWDIAALHAEVEPMEVRNQSDD